MNKNQPNITVDWNKSYWAYKACKTVLEDWK